jgi:phosphoglycolate phosphatase-like HAD superfamily hydrolase
MKPIIATTFSGLFISSEPWKKAHYLWFDEAAKILKDNTIKKWKHKKNYFSGVDLVMKQRFPKLTDEQRTKKARELFFASVLRYMKKKNVKFEKNISFFRQLKKKYRIALITTNTSFSLKKMLKANDLATFFDIIIASKEQEKDDKQKVFNRFIAKYGKPLLYIGGDRKDTYDFCKKQNIPCVFANFEHAKDIQGIKTARNLKELKLCIQEF